MTGGNGDWIRLIEQKVDEIESDVKSLLAWRNWVLGGVAGITFIGGIFAKQIIALLVGKI